MIFFVCPVAVKGPAIDSRYAPASHEGLGNLPAGSSECRAVQGGVEGKRYIPVYAKLTDGSGNGRSAKQSPDQVEPMALASPAVTCAPSAHPSESLPLAFVVGPPILEYHAGPGAFIGEIVEGSRRRVILSKALRRSM